jgi:hypothetical protein
MLPWLDPDLLEDFEGQPAIYDQIRFSSPSAQEIWLRSWVSNRQSASSSELSEDIQFSITWYPGRFCPGIGSIIHDARPTAGGGSILDYLPTRYGDVAILEEPEHLSWSGFVLLLAVQRKYFLRVASLKFFTFPSQVPRRWPMGRLLQLGHWYCPHRLFGVRPI